MDEEKAARILARELGDKIGRHIVFEESSKDRLIRNSTYFDQIEEPVFYTIKENYITFAKTSEYLTKSLVSSYKSFADANYFFMQNRHVTLSDTPNPQSHFIVTPYTLIGESEKQNIKKLCYKDVPENILNAMKMFSIDNYIESYESYINNCKGYNQSDDFLNFIFSIPYEDQNIQCNKFLLKNSKVRDYHEILTNEYVKGKSFQEYFDCLDNDCQQKVAKYLTNVKERNLSHDSFLWSKGFKETKLDYMQDYKENANNFIKYFKTKNHEDKKTILKDIMNCDYTNKAVADWLNENEIELLRKVSMDG